MTVILDPTDERVPVARQLTTRTGALKGRVSFLDISKPRGNILIDRIEELLLAQHPEVTVHRYAKPTFTKPCPDGLRAEIRQNSDFVIEALAD